MKIDFVTFAVDKHVSKFQKPFIKDMHIYLVYPLTYSVGVGAVRPPPSLGFLPFTQNVFRQTIPEIPDLSKMFVADAHMKRKKINKFSFTPSQSTFKYRFENSP